MRKFSLKCKEAIYTLKLKSYNALILRNYIKIKLKRVVNKSKKIKIPFKLIT